MNRRSQYFDLHPNCCFCGGSAKATTEDHQPARAVFDSRQWPEGYSFPACGLCNGASRTHEQAFALLCRLGPSVGETDLQKEEIRKLCVAVANNFPDGLIRMMTVNEKRRHFHEQGIPRPKNSPLRDVPMAIMEIEKCQSIVEMIARKLFCALHYLHTQNIVPAQGRIVYGWATNAEHRMAAALEDFGRQMRGRRLLVRSTKIINDQFDYSFAVADEGALSAFFCAFRDSMAIFGTVFPEGLPSHVAFDKLEKTMPFNWKRDPT